ncbi:DEAD/DEAH box helicase [Raoultibacter phocaeensis]|uniref:DEAD/DEAH box helicase n=1 Tax=Raoultibacter phocaeensis TaxID=2479841 RepID=UPI00111B4E73|nr:DEAD/DEAH box helicase [Raoultibacter phocaeensis]
MALPFNELGLSEKTLAAVKRLGYEAPTPVQEQAIPLVLKGRDIIAAAKTGTGKTAAFSLPALDRLGHIQRGQGPLMLVVSPTRELADQIGDVCRAIATSTHHRILTVVGGLSLDPQIKQLKHGVDILIATPGRLNDLMERGAVRLSNVEMLVLDEADRMLDMGFWPQMKKIIAACPKNRQTLLFSATIDDQIEKSVGSLLHDPAYVEIAHRGETADTVEQFVIPATQTTKADLLKAVLEEKGSDRVIVFARTRSRADSCTRRLKRAGYTVEAIHSDRSQAQRKRALDNFSSGKTHVLVATDVLARGIDVTDVDYVINYDLPNQPEDYVHRIGRTGRAGETGFAVSFVSPEQEPWLKDIEKLIKQKIPTMELTNFDPEQAEADAAARATRAAGRRDPELAAAAAEYAKAQKKKAAKPATDAPSGKPAKKKSSRAPQQQPVKTNRKAPKQTQAHQAGAKPSKQGQAAQANSKGPRQGQALPSKANAPRQGQAAKGSGRTQGSDLRPGRAHRAAVARRRSR